MDPKRFTRRLIALGAAMFLCALVFVITLFDAQIVNGDDYLDKSIRTNAKTETVKASRGILTDRNGKVLVSNRAVYTLNFDSSLVSSDELNDALLRVIGLMNAQGVEIKDTLPLARTSPYAYDTANGSAKTLVKYLVSLKWINEQNVGDDGLPTTLTGSALYLKLRSEYGIDETLPNSTVRTLIGLRYSLASAKMNGSTTFEFASDVDVSLISLIKDGNYAGVQVDTSSVRVYETDYAAHVLGYTGSIQDWDDYKDKDGYTLASTVGISGVENAFEDYLHGSDGKRLVTLNESGKITGELYSVEPKPGLHRGADDRRRLSGTGGGGAQKYRLFHDKIRRHRPRRGRGRRAGRHGATCWRSRRIRPIPSRRSVRTLQSSPPTPCSRCGIVPRRANTPPARP